MKVGMSINYFSELRGLSGVTTEDSALLALTDLANRTGHHPIDYVKELLEQVYHLENINSFIDAGYHTDTSVNDAVKRLLVISICPSDNHLFSS